LGERSIDEVAAALSAYLSARTGAPLEVADLTRMSNGWESDVYAFDAPALVQGSDHGFVLRLYFGANAGPTATNEYLALELLAQAGYPVPRVYLVEPSLAPLGRAFLIMARVEGRPLGQRWREATEARFPYEIDDFCALLVRLHTLKWQHLANAARLPRVAIAEQLGIWKRIGAQFPSTAFTAGMAWLDRASIEITAPQWGLVHWDFHPDNVLLDREEQPWVIDWTQFQMTDVRFDLAWTLTVLASERNGHAAQLIRTTYLAQRGWCGTAMEAELPFFEAAACAKRLFSMFFSLMGGADAVGMRPGAEATMNRQLARFAVVYKRWLAITATPLTEIESLLAEHL
jgi:aminoglycoside phosphotransferase (APT) family kinase protein